jgi:hypothetical protein
MGMGGFVLVGYGQGVLKQVEVKKFKHNTRVLNEAKQALLQFAYNYPVTNGNGPGRLPCPDTDNNGIPNALFNCSASLGRLPWNQQNLNLYDIRDADGQRLWYAVSDNFSTQDAANLNSDTYGTLTVRDQSGQIIYDGSSTLPKSGVAAVIIAPGAITARNGVLQDRSPGAEDPFDTTADTEPGIVDADNYLDQLGVTEDNAIFTLGSATDGFVLGPIDDGTGSIVINDQMIVITASEIIEVAEKAVLQAYRDAINDYLARTGTVYPWLYNYAGVPDVPGLSSYYPAVSTASAADFATELTTNLDNIGRIPSIFDDYFTETTSELIETRLGVSLSLTYPVWPTPVNASSSPDLFFNNPGVMHTLNIQTTDKLINVGFDDIADVVGQDGRLTGTAITDELFFHELYFWDEDNDPTAPTGIWTLCPAGADDPSDCDRDDLGNPTPGAGNDKNAQVLRVVIELNFDTAVNGGVVNFDTDYTTVPVIATAAADGTAHARITATFAGTDVIVNTLPLSARYEIDRHYHDSFDVQESGTLDLDDFIPGTLTLGVRFYPELPDWAFDNGWHDSVMMAYAQNYRPDILGACVEGTDCIQINNLAGNNDNKIAILTLAGQHNWDDDTDLNFINDLPTVFDAENADILDVDGTEYLYDRNQAGGNDVVMIVTECSTC